MSTLQTPTDHADVRRAPRLRALGTPTLVLLAVAVVATLALAWQWRWTCDDAFINFRAVRNILEGNGPVFNAGERVEVGTSPLWLWLLAACAAVLPVDVAWIAVVLGAVASAVGVLLACLGAAEINRSVRGARPPLLLPAGVLVFLALPATWAFLTSGLETGLIFGWLGAVWFGTARQAVAGIPARPVWLLVLLGLGPLVRPDLGLVTGLVGLWLLVAVPSSGRRRLRDVAIAAAVPVAYQVVRMGWFGLLVPNTAVAKESGRQLWSRGVGYLVDFGAPYALYVPALLCAALLVLTGWGGRWDRRVRALVAVTVLAGVAQAVYVVRVGGDFMHGRLLLPALFLLLCPVAVVPAPRRATWARWAALALVAGTAAWAAVCATSLRIDYQNAIGPRGIADERGFYVRAAGVPHPVLLSEQGRGLPAAWGRQMTGDARAGSHQVYAQSASVPGSPYPRLVPLAEAPAATYFIVYQAGLLGYGSPSDAVVLDVYGLTDPLGSHIAPGPPGRPGHEKTTPVVWFWAQHSFAPLPGQPADPALDRRAAPADLVAARGALRCGALAELVAATSAPMSWSRFWDNLLGAPARTGLRIPADPQEAAARFC